MKRLSLATLIAVAIMGLSSGLAFAADHLDSPTVANDSAADINDLYVFRSTDSDDNGAIGRTVFIMTVSPLADANSMFSDAVEYTFVVRDMDTDTVYEITCTADNAIPQNVTCSVPGGAETTTEVGDETDGDRNGGTDVIAFAGLRDDPFYFDLEDYQTVYTSVLEGNPDPSALLDDMGDDFFAGANALALVVDVRNSVFGGATNIAVWARTTRISN